MNGVTAHCLVKNEENFIKYAIQSVVDFVDTILVFDTGSTDKTVEVITGLMREYPGKIVFEEKGKCDKKRHTQLRQEMVERTITEWFMVLDGDEVWPKRAMIEALEVVKAGTYGVIHVNFFECVGDIFHTHRKEGYKAVRFKKTKNVVWTGEYGEDSFLFGNDQTVLLKNRFWHLTHLERSSQDYDTYSSGTSRGLKRRLTYFIIGKKIRENIPEVFGDGVGFAVSPVASFVNFLKLIFDAKQYTQKFAK